MTPTQSTSSSLQQTQSSQETTEDEDAGDTTVDLGGDEDVEVSF